ncbi:MAG: hypothetical protein K8H88_30605 [Sandaracinaceae bacterium]|nr:hypothetical protein [Sandaracinaceae bacterium]
MHALLSVVLLLLMVPSASAQREARAAGALFRGHDTGCWSTSAVPCEGAGGAEIEVEAGRTPVDVRVVSVEVLPAGLTVWRQAGELHVMRRADWVRTEPPHRPRPVIRFEARARDTLLVFFSLIRAQEARVRVTLEVGGRRVVVEAEHRVTVESPDPDP